MNYRWLTYLSLALLLVIQACTFNHFFYDAQRDGALKYEANPDFHELSVINTTIDTLSGLLLDPGITSKGTILMIHGNSGNITRWTENAKYFYNHNYRILVFDYEGYGKSTGKPTHKNVVLDTELFLNYLYSRYGKIIIWGLSLGGNLSVEIAMRNTDKVEALMIEGSFTSHNEIARTKVPMLVRPFVFIIVRSPYKSKNIIEKLHMPVLIAHSKVDKVVHYEMGEELFKRANEPKFFLELQGDHCMGIMNNTSEYYQWIDSIVQQ
jgi:esterase/lipase